MRLLKYKRIPFAVLTNNKEAKSYWTGLGVWTSNSIYVITQGMNPRMIYRGLGADCVLHSRTGDVAFLLQSSENG